MTGRTSVCDAKFPVGIRLVDDGVDHFSQIFLRSLPYRNDDGELRTEFKFVLPLRLQFFVSRFGQIPPLGVVVIIVQTLKFMF